ncbi:hypothetical protein [Xanthomonas arboricola]|uniref:hypothetical protein n=1 Tax=Xanthomonas arboricola TaxID=56448 RepID=UPI000AA5BCB6|nr:hypothetical protein [Xanthomonas arboricola]MBB3848484.1 hypothetical protein [Xanthomonas arboricola]
MSLKVLPIRSSRPRPSEPCDIPIRMGGEEIGFLCLLRGLEAQVSAMTQAQSAVLTIESGDIQLSGASYTFVGDYVVISADSIDMYDTARASSSFWGQYLHESDAPVGSLEVFRDDEVIQVDAACILPTERHAESLSKYASYGRPTDRFLFLYHFLELDFDREVVKRIKALDDNNLNGVGQIIREIGSGDEMSRLLHLVRDVPIDELESWASELKNHPRVSKSIFYEYGKDSNPVKLYEDFKCYFIDTTAVRNHIFSDAKVNARPTVDLCKDYNKSIRKCVAYWIYRVRCCVAHNKLGEYHLMSPEDMSFLERFAIPLLRVIVRYRMTV